MAFVFFTSNPNSIVDVANVSPNPGINHHYLHEIIASWMTFFPDAEPDPEMDVEDWVENAVRLHEAMTNFPDIPIYTHRENVLYFEGREVAVEDAPAAAMFLGSHTGNDENLAKTYGIQPLNDIGQKVFRYWDSPAFVELCERDIALADASLNGVGGIRERMNDFKKAGHSAVYIKNAISKYSRPMKINVDDTVTTSEDLYDIALATLHLEGDKEAFLIQEVVDMRFEYRFIVVDGEVVAGAACIEEFTPINNLGKAFDTQLREDRSQVSAVLNTANTSTIVDKMRQCAELFAAKARVADEPLLNYTVDTALNDYGKPLVIECNPLKNYGLYAMDYASILKAQVKSLGLENKPNPKP